jgi:hypothetical protein
VEAAKIEGHKTIIHTHIDTDFGVSRAIVFVLIV